MLTKVLGILEEIKKSLSYQTKLLEHLVKNNEKGKTPQDFDKTLEKVSDMMLSKGIKNIIPKEIIDSAVKVVKEMNKEA